MDKKIKREWLKALRSGKYLQADNVLMRYSGAMCCLGVLGDIQGVPHQAMRGMRKEVLPRGKNAGLNKKQRHKLASMNDRGKTFAEIADFIQKHY